MIEVELGGIPMRFETSPTLFSPNGLDAGTRAMLCCAQFLTGDKVLDLGCGYGVVGVYATKLIGGRLIMVTKCRDWYKKQAYLDLRRPVIKEIDQYFVFTAEKRRAGYAKK